MVLQMSAISHSGNKTEVDLKESNIIIPKIIEKTQSQKEVSGELESSLSKIKELESTKKHLNLQVMDVENKIKEASQLVNKLKQKLIGFEVLELSQINQVKQYTSLDIWCDESQKISPGWRATGVFRNELKGFTIEISRSRGDPYDDELDENENETQWVPVKNVALFKKRSKTCILSDNLEFVIHW